MVAAGTFESARLLLASRSRWFPNGLGNRFDHVGRHCTVHPSFGHELPAPEQRLPLGIHRTHAFNDRFRRERLDACHFQLQVSPQRVELHSQPELEPRAENRVQIEARRSEVAEEPARASLWLGYSDLDRRTLERAKEIQARLAGAWGLELDQATAIEKFRMHPAGTCRMAGRGRDGVVDRNLRVFGIDNLFVSGACVFPIAGTANPTLTVVALTLRLAEHLRQRLG